jgi:ABC-type multidrug transport system fused ATPase/permease subunit
VSKSIFDDVLKGKLKDKTRILVTHGLHLLDKCDKVIVMEEGRIVCNDTPDVVKQDENFIRIALELEVQISQASVAELPAMPAPGMPAPAMEEIHLPADPDLPSDRLMLIPMEAIQTQKLPPQVVNSPGNSRNRKVSFALSDPHGRGSDHHIHMSNMPDGQSPALRRDVLEEISRMNSNSSPTKIQKGKMTVAEHMASGDVDFSEYRRFFKGGGVCLGVLNLLVFSVLTVLLILSNWWAGQWAKVSYPLSTLQFGLIHLGITFLISGFTVLSCALFILQISTSANKNHDQMVDCLIKRPMSFYDTTPIGQILQRCGRDTDDIDIMIPFLMTSAIRVFFLLMGVFIYTSVVLPFIIPFFLLIFWLARIWYIRVVSIEITWKRLTQKCISPMLSNITEFIQGIFWLLKSNPRCPDHQKL